MLLLLGDNNHKCNYSRYACDLAYAKQVLEERWGTVETVFDVTDYQALCERIGRYDISEIPQLRYFA